MERIATARLRGDALRHNVRRVRQAAPRSSIFAVVKGQGYGHGLRFSAATLAGDCEGLAVACTGEGVELRAAGFRDPRICVLNGPADADELRACAAHELEPLIHQAWQARALAAGDLPAMRVWLKVDSGMGRLGVRPPAVAEWHMRLNACPSVRPPVGLMTHMASADECEDPYTDLQWRTFEAAISGLDGPRSGANSACVLGWPRTHADWVRPGIMLYGCSPFGVRSDLDLDLEPAMTLTTRLIAINQLEAGAGVGYGRTWCCPEAMPVGVAAIGYADGYPRHARTGTPVLVGGRRAPLIGRVSMDKIMIDLRGLPDAAVGDEVVLWGRGLPVEEIAAAADTIGYELLNGVHGRVAVVEI